MCNGSAETTHHSCCLVYASKLNMTVVSVNYRLAPEHTFPSGPEDCLDAVKYILQHIQDFQCNGKIVISGDSAGGMMTFVTSCALNEEALIGALALYPNTAYDNGSFESWKTMATGHPGNTAAICNKLLSNYYGMAPAEFEQQLGDDPVLRGKAFPLYHKNLKQMPPTFLVTCEYDILRDEGKAMVEALQNNGVKVSHHHYEQEHGFMCTDGRNDEFEDCLAKMEEWIKEL